MTGLVRVLTLMLVAWIVGCTIYHTCVICHACGSRTTTVESFSPFTVSDGTFTATTGDVATFPQSGSDATIAAGAKAQYQKMAQHLKDNPNRVLNLVGQYKSTESTANLGKSRAEAIKNAILAAGSGLAGNQITTNGEVNDRLRFIGERTDGGIKYAFGAARENTANTAVNNARASAPVAVTPTASNDGNIAIRDGGAFNVQAPAPWFKRSGDTPEMNPKLNNIIKQVAGYLKGNPSKLLKISAAYKADEKNRSWFDNLGVARANSIKNAILKSDSSIDKDQIETTGRLENNLAFDNNDRTNGRLGFAFGNFDKNALATAKESALTGIKTRLKAAPKNFYFDPGSSVIDLDNEMRTYFSELKQYLNYYKDEKVTLTGHTDSDGGAAGNKALGQKRANLIKDYMTRNGVNASQILTTSQGEAQPIDTNDTPEGKAKNRRVAISI